MTSVNINNKQVPVTGPEGVDMQTVVTSPAFSRWLSQIEPKFVVKSIKVQSVDFFPPNNRVGFVKFSATVEDETGQWLPGIVFARGPAVGILCILRCESLEYTLLTVQPRMPIGRFEFMEIPAGMLDDDKNFAGAAAKEMEQETSIKINASDLVDLTQLTYGDDYPGMYPSAGGCDEYIKLFLFETEVTKEKINELQKVCTGELDEGEKIRLKIIPLDDLWRSTSDAKALSALTLYYNLVAAGKISKPSIK